MIALDELKHILGSDRRDDLEQLAQRAQRTTIRYFGRTISLYAPLYLSDYCENPCLYCGFGRDRKFKRNMLTPDQMDDEMKNLAATGIQSVLLLTGESPVKTPVEYLETAIQIAARYFPSIGLEVYPMDEDQYRRLYRAGADSVTIYQETYHRDRYRALHPGGRKADYDYRYQTPERIARAGLHTINMGVLLGLSEVSRDVHQLYGHLEYMEKNYPGVEYSLSFPRIIPIKDSGIDYVEVSDRTLITLICLTRVLFPRVGINLSTRERPYIRDHALSLGVTRISAASRTTVGGYAPRPESGEAPQFSVMDNRRVPEITALLREKGFDPVFTDWRRIPSGGPPPG